MAAFDQLATGGVNERFAITSHSPLATVDSLYRIKSGYVSAT